MAKVRRPGLSRERVVDAAIALVDRAGLAGLSMRELGSALGVEAMTLYHYFPNKDALLDAVVERVVLATSHVPAATPRQWRHGLRTFGRSFRTELLQHPRLVPLIATRPVMTLPALRRAEQAAGTLAAAGFSPSQAFHALNAVATFVIGHTLAEAGATPGHEDSAAATETLGKLPPGEFPIFLRAVRAGLGSPADHQARFDFALEALLAGMAPARRRSARARSR